MNTHCFFTTVLAVTLLRASSWAALIPATHVEQTGQPPEGAAQPGLTVMANEPEAKAGMFLDFDLNSVQETFTPEARLQLPDVLRLNVKHPGQKPPPERCVMRVFVPGPGGKAEQVGSLPTKAGGSVNSYTLIVTQAVNEALARPAGKRKLRLELRLDGKPVYFETYGVQSAEGKMPGLEIAPVGDWKDDWQRRLEPVTSGSTVYRETCLPLAESRDQELQINLLYPAQKIAEVIHSATGETYQEGRDWVLREGKVFLPVGTHIPIQIESEFFAEEKKDKDGNLKVIHSSVRLVPDTWYRQRQIEVSYAPAKRDWSLPAPLSTLDQLPRLKRMLQAKTPLHVMLFGDSISAGCDSSGLYGVWPYQPGYGDLVAKKLAQHYGGEVVFTNPSRPGATSAYGSIQAETQVAAFKPDLAIIAYGMNDRAPKRVVEYKQNMEKIMDTIRAKSPDTEFIVVTPMLNNPKQSTGLDPVKSIRDQALGISRPGVAFVDMTSTHLELLKHKDYLDISGNGANHPNDFLHRIYAQRILEVLIPAAKK
ncbi:MAG: SGNH/GDSL hydrolase family protein [Chthoniobacteraceae bacterium]